jgi:hypothetical protein
MEFRLVRSILPGLAFLEGQIVRDAENPAPKIIARPTELEVPEEREKYVLNDLFRIGYRQADRKHVAEQSVPMLFEQTDDHVLGFRTNGVRGSFCHGGHHPAESSA